MSTITPRAIPKYGEFWRYTKIDQAIVIMNVCKNPFHPFGTMVWYEHLDDREVRVKMSLSHFMGDYIDDEDVEHPKYTHVTDTDEMNRIYKQNQNRCEDCRQVTEYIHKCLSCFEKADSKSK